MRRVPTSAGATMLAATVAVMAAIAATAGTPAQAGPAAAPTVTVRTLHFAVTVGPAPQEACDIVGDLYTPSTATTANPAPAILTTNGFGGSKDGQAGIAMTEAKRGYVVLSYSGLGFGAEPQKQEPGSTCKITLDDPAYDGEAGSQLISFLGGKTGIGFTSYGGSPAATHSGPVSIDNVRLDHTAHDGSHPANDPRVGMIGGSYGGQIQFAVADVDPRLDMIIPIITWNDLAYSLTPNNTSNRPPGVTAATPGVAKIQWTALFTGLGIVDGAEKAGAGESPADAAADAVPCPNFATQACPGVVTAGGTGYPDAATISLLRHASVTTEPSGATSSSLRNSTSSVPGSAELARLLARCRVADGMPTRSAVRVNGAVVYAAKVPGASVSGRLWSTALVSV